MDNTPGPAQTVGADIGPLGFQQDMFAIDTLAGPGSPNGGSVGDRDSSPATFTGGDTGQGLGGVAEPMPDGGTLYDRRGF